MSEIKGKKHLIAFMSIVCCLFLLITGVLPAKAQEIYSEDFTGNVITNTAMFGSYTKDNGPYTYFEDGVCKLGYQESATTKTSIGTVFTKEKFGPVSVTADVCAQQVTGQTTVRSALFIGLRTRAAAASNFYNTGNNGIWFSFNPTGNMYVGNRNGSATTNLETSVTNPLNYSTMRKVRVVDTGAEILVFGYDDTGIAVQIVRAVVNTASVDIYSGTATTNPTNLLLTLPLTGYVVFQGNSAKGAIDNITIQKHISEDFTGNKINQNNLFSVLSSTGTDADEVSYKNDALRLGVKGDDTVTDGYAIMRTAAKYGPISLSADISCVQDSRGTTNRNALFIGLRVPSAASTYTNDNISLWFSFINSTAENNMYVGNNYSKADQRTSITQPLNFGTVRTVRVIDSGPEIRVYGYDNTGTAVQLARAVVNPTTVDIYQGTNGTISATLNITLSPMGYVAFQGNNAACTVDNVILSSSPYFADIDKAITTAFTDTGNTPVTSLNRNTTLRTKCTFNNYEGDDVSAQLIVALYDNNNTLEKVGLIDPLQIPKYDGKSFYVDMQLPDIDLSSHKVKAFLWKDGSTMKPLQGYTPFPVQ